MSDATHMDSPHRLHPTESRKWSDAHAASESRSIPLAERIERRQWLRRLVLADAPAADTPYERDGRHINAPVWPWLTAGSIVAALFLVFVLVEYYFS